MPSKCNSLSPNSDQHQISPCNINAYPTPEFVNITCKHINLKRVNFLDIKKSMGTRYENVFFDIRGSRVKDASNYLLNK